MKRFTYRIEAFSYDTPALERWVNDQTLDGFVFKQIIQSESEFILHRLVIMEKEMS